MPRRAQLPDVEKNVPFPSKPATLADIISTMEPGDSFVIQRTRLSRVYAAARLIGARITTAPIRDERGDVIEGQVRVWRKS